MSEPDFMKKGFIETTLFVTFGLLRLLMGAIFAMALSALVWGTITGVLVLCIATLVRAEDPVEVAQLWAVCQGAISAFIGLVRYVSSINSQLSKSRL